MNQSETKFEDISVSRQTSVWKPIPASRRAQHTINPIRRVVDRMKITPNPMKELISLSIGDPTHYGNMLPPVEALEAIMEAVQLSTSHGYPPSFGNETFCRILESRTVAQVRWMLDVLWLISGLGQVY
jgi:hypothetical protein